MTTFILAFDMPDGGRQPVLDFLDSRADVTDWHASMNNVVIVVSSGTTTQLAESFRDRFGSLSFILAPLDLNGANGVLPRITWDFIAAAAEGDARPHSTAKSREGALAEPTAA